jgi:AraC-like DNA-binding protein
MIAQYDFFRTKYGDELLIDLIQLEDLEKYIIATPVHRLMYYDITIISGGTGTFSIDGIEHRVTRGTVLFSSPGQIRRWNTSKTPRGYVVIFEQEFLTTFFNDTKFVESLSFFNSSGTLILDREDYKYLSGVLESMKREITVHDLHMLRALLYQVLIFLNRRFQSREKLSPNRYVHYFAQFVGDSYKQHRSVNYYADLLHITPGHLNSLVKQHLGVTPKQYILNRNMLEARRLLQYTTMGIDEIATTLNYESTSYFVRVFRLHTDITPLNFRKLSNP